LEFDQKVSKILLRIVRTRIFTNYSLFDKSPFEVNYFINFEKLLLLIQNSSFDQKRHQYW